MRRSWSCLFEIVLKDRIKMKIIKAALDLKGAGE